MVEQGILTGRIDDYAETQMINIIYQNDVWASLFFSQKIKVLQVLLARENMFLHSQIQILLKYWVLGVFYAYINDSLTYYVFNKIFDY